MTLRQRLLLIAAATVLVLVLSLAFVSRAVLLNQFEELERVETLEDVARAKKILQLDIEALREKTADYAAWDDTCAFVRKPNEPFIRSNFEDATFEMLRLNFILIYDAAGKLVYSKGYDLESKKPVVPGKALLTAIDAKDRFLLRHEDTNDDKAGLMLLADGTAKVASMPILTSHRKGPILGSVVFGRYLDSISTRKLSDAAGVKVQLFDFANPGLSRDFRKAVDQLDVQGLAVVPRSSDVVCGYALLQDLYGERALVLQVDANRQAVQHGKAVVNKLLLLLAGLGAVFGAMAAILVERIVLSRINRLAAEVGTIGTSGSLGTRISPAWDDEFSRVAEAINRMLGDLQHAERRYRAIVEDQTEMIARYKPDGTLTFCNLAYARAWKRSIVDLVGQKIQNLFTFSEDQNRFNDHLKHIAQLTPKDSAISREVSSRDMDGRLDWFHWTDRAIFDAQGKLVEMQTVGRIITKRKLAEEDRNRLASILEATSDLVGIAAPNGRHLYLNRAGRKLLGVGESEDITQFTIDQAHPKSVLDFVLKEAIATAVREGVWSGESLLLSRDGKEIPVSQVILAHKDATGNVEYLSTIIRDIRETKQAHEELIRLSSAIENAAEAVVITDLEANIQYVNPAFEEVSGYPRVEVMGKNPRILKSGKLGPEYYRKMWEALASGETWTGDFINKRKDGTFFHETGSIAPIRTPSGKRIGYVAVKRDVTHQIQLEAELRQAQKMEAVGQLAGGIAHDFNNILASIMGYAKLAADEALAGTELRDDLQQIITAGKRGKELVEQMLVFSRQAGMTGKKMSHQLGEVIEEGMKLLRPALPSNIIIELNLPHGLPFATIDPIEIHQVIINLCLNASQAMPDGGKLQIRLEQQSISRDRAGKEQNFVGDQQLISGQYLVLSIEDTGCGIEKENLPRIFEPFFTTRKKQKGTGMGLAVVYGIIKSHHGAIHVYSEAGKGTTMRVYLPTSQTAEHYYRPEVKSELKGGSESILVVDDEPPLAQMIGKTLSRLGYRVTVKTSSTEAFELFQHSPGDFELVVTDQTMPGLTGDKLAEEIHKIRPDIPIILCSGFSEVLTPEREREIRVSKLVRKPFVGDELELEIRKLLDERKPK